jgi:uncharacterized membrane protein
MAIAFSQSGPHNRVPGFGLGRRLAGVSNLPAPNCDKISRGQVDPPIRTLGTLRICGIKASTMNTQANKKIARISLGSGLLLAGLSHLTFSRKAFQAQVPGWVSMGKDETVIYSGIAELLLGCGLICTNRRYQPAIGKLAALFFVAIFPGNISQFVHRRDAFGLNTDGRRFARLFFQPVLVYWALKSA